MAISIPAFTVDARISGLFADQIRNYFICEEQGVDPNNPGSCDEFRDAFRRYSFPQLSATSFVLLNLFPTILLVYTVNFEELKAKWMKYRAKKKRSDGQLMAPRQTNLSSVASFTLK